MYMVEFKNWLIKNSVIASAIILALLMLIIFLKIDIDKRVAEIKNKRLDLATRLYSLESLTLLRADAQKAETLRVTLENSLPSKDSIIGFVKNLEGIAKANNVGFGFAFESEVPGTETEPTANLFTMHSSGSYSNFLRFLKAMELGKYYINFNYLDLSQKGKDYEVQIKGRVFSQ